MCNATPDCNGCTCNNTFPPCWHCGNGHDWIDDEPDVAKEKEKSEFERLKAFFFGKQFKGTVLEEEYRSQGRCPHCGELGRIHLSTMICSIHGPY